MIEVKVVGVALDTSNQHVVLLGDSASDGEEGPLMPIWVGPQEASSILIGAGQLSTPRPMPHDLIYSILESLDVEVTRIEITNLDQGTFLAVIHMTSDEREHIVDARPSDAISIAVRTNSPIFVNNEVFKEASIDNLFDDDIPDDADTGPPAAGAAIDSGLDPESFKKEIAEAEAELKDFQGFKEFLENVNPEDFDSEDSDPNANPGPGPNPND